ncbi:MAG: Uma2 family endonuclease [Acidobacteriota bacterium]
MSFTYADLLEMPEELHCEIFDGELIVNESRTTRHQGIVGSLALALMTYEDRSHLGTVFFGPLDVVFTPRWVLTPDILFIRGERKAIITETNISGPPDLTVEIVDESTRRRDEIIKLKAYEEFGVGEYWIVDPALESVKIFRRGGSGCYERAVEGASLTSPLFPGLEIALAEVFAE